MTSRGRWARRAAVIATLAIVVAGCGDDGGSADEVDTTTDDAPSALRVGSFNFPESQLLAELYAQALEAADIPVQRLGAEEAREIVAPALEQDQIDLVPEYLGTATEYFGFGESGPATATVADLRARLEPRGLTALDPAPAQNTNVFVVLADSGLGPRLSDLEDVAATLRFGGTPECRERDLCLAGLATTYGLRFAEFVTEPDTHLRAEALRRDEIDVGLLFSTDAELTEEFLVLEDDKALQPAENVVPVMRLDALERWGEATITATLDAVSAELTTDELRSLNRRVAEGTNGAEAVTDWLVRHALVDLL